MRFWRFWKHDGRGEQPREAPKSILDIPADLLLPEDKPWVEKIREFGWLRMYVEGDDASPSFAYSTGHWVNLGAPEIILFSMPEQLSHDILWDVHRAIEADTALPTGKAISGIFGNADAVFMPVSAKNREKYLRWSARFYTGNPFPALHLIWPDTNGRFPWDPDFEDRFKADQPDLTDKGWITELRQ